MKIQDAYDDKIEHEIDIQDLEAEDAIRVEGWRYRPSCRSLVFRLEVERGGQIWTVERFVSIFQVEAWHLNLEANKASAIMLEALVQSAET